MSTGLLWHKENSPVGVRFTKYIKTSQTYNNILPLRGTAGTRTLTVALKLSNYLSWLTVTDRQQNTVLTIAILEIKSIKRVNSTKRLRRYTECPNRMSSSKPVTGQNESCPNGTFYTVIIWRIFLNLSKMLLLFWINSLTIGKHPLAKGKVLDL